MGSDLGEPSGGISMGSVLEFDDPALLRAVRVADVLHGCGQVLAGSVGTGDTYALSSQAERIDVFISHTWATGRRHKFVALAMHFNLNMACLLAVMALVLTAALTHLAVSRGYWSLTCYIPGVSIVSMLAFSIALFFGHEAQALFGFRDKRSAFLDKVCIHQTDGRLKERGILSLGAFLHKSDSMVVCFTGLYLQRRWTVYEFASFLLVRGEACPGVIHIVPTSLPVLIIASSLCSFAGIVLARLSQILGGYLAVGKSFVLVAVLCILLTIARRGARQRQDALALFKGFTLANTSCSSEADRALVRRNIALMMRHFAYVRPQASDAEALMAFDEFVRTAGLQAFVASVGHVGISYRLLMPNLLTFWSDSLQWWSACSTQGCDGHTTPSQILFGLLGTLASVFAVIPLAVAMAFHLTRFCLALQGPAEVAYCVAMGVLEAGAILVVDPIISPLRPWLMGAALQSARSSAGFIVYCAALFIATALVYRKPQRQAAGAVAAARTPLASEEPALDAGGAALAAGVGAWEDVEKCGAVVEIDSLDLRSQVDDGGRKKLEAL